MTLRINVKTVLPLSILYELEPNLLDTQERQENFNCKLTDRRYKLFLACSDRFFHTYLLRKWVCHVLFI
jgi:hypothetical protein